MSATQATRELLGYTNTALIGREVEELFQPERQHAIKEILLGCSLSPNRSAITLREQCVRASGEVFQAKIHAIAITGTSHNPVAVLLMIQESADQD